MWDFLIRRGRVVDGTGVKAYQADVAIQGGRITDIGDFPHGEAKEVIEAEGKIVCPGFIDIHTHNDLHVIRDDYATLFEPYLRQGITTCVANNCGWSVAPWLKENEELFRATIQSMGVSKDFNPSWETQKEFHQYLIRRGLPINFIPLAAHGPLRIAVMGDAPRFSTPEELERMKKLLAEGMDAGCRGFSTGLTYFPGMYAHTDEIVELARVSAKYGGRYVTHVRGQCNTYDLAVAEAIEISERSGCALQLSHVAAVPDLGRLADLVYYTVGIIEAINRVLPLPGIPNGVLKKAMKAVDRALNRGLDVGMDFMPYVMGNSTVTSLYPPWANIGGIDSLLARLRDQELREKIRHDVEHLKPRWPHWEQESWSDNYIRALGWKMFKVLSVGSEKNSYMEGRRIENLAREAGKDPFDFLADLTLEENGSMTYMMGLPPRPWAEKVFTRIQDHPQLSIGTDSLFPEKGAPPLTTYGCFVRVIEHYVKQLKIYSLEDAIRRCTGLAASRFCLQDRGVLRKEAAADLVVFDLDKIHDNSTWDDPVHFPDGIENVFVNGIQVVTDGCYDPSAKSGQLLTR